MADENDNVQPISKGPRTKASFLKAIESELNEARVKQFKVALKELYLKRTAAEKVVAGINEEISVLAEEYSDVIAE